MDNKNKSLSEAQRADARPLSIAQSIASMVKKLEKGKDMVGLDDFGEGQNVGLGEALALIRSGLLPAFESAVKEIGQMESEEFHQKDFAVERNKVRKQALKILGAEKEAE